MSFQLPAIWNRMLQPNVESATALSDIMLHLFPESTYMMLLSYRE